MTGHLKTPQTQKSASVIIQKSEQTKENTQTCVDGNIQTPNTAKMKNLKTLHLHYNFNHSKQGHKPQQYLEG